MGVLIPFGHLIPIAEVQRLTGLKRHQVYYRIEQQVFPVPAMKSGRAARWSRRDVEQWTEREAAGRADRQARRAARSTTELAGSSAPTTPAT